MRRNGVLALLTMVVALAATVAVDTTDARRLGGGRSFGAQRQSILPPAARAPTPAPAPGAAAQPVMPAQPGALAPRAATPAASAAGAAAPRGASRWLGPIAGLAAGLGLAALLSHFGLSESFASFLLIALIGAGLVFLVRAFLARRGRPSMQYAGPGPTDTLASAAPPPRAEPAWGGAQRVEPVFTPASAPAPGATSLPPGFDRDGFVRQARLQFNRLQAAYDAGDRRLLANVMTPAMFAEVSRDLATRSAQESTEVVDLDADVLEVVTEGDQHCASVRFTGVLREDGGEAKPFDEVWNLTKPVDDSSGWLLAGIQQGETAALAH